MSAGIANLVIEQNATFKKRLLYKDKLSKPINLTGFGARLVIRDANGAVICDLSTANGNIVITATAGIIDLTISADETKLMTFQKALYDMILIAPDGTKARLLEGKVTLSPGQAV